MSSLLQTTSDSLSKLVRWAHSHGTICSLIPSLQHLTRGSYDTLLTSDPSSHSSSSSVPVAVWSCGAGHAYHWPLSDHGDGCRGLVNVSQSQERFVVGRPANKGTVRTPCDLSCSEAASEVEEFSSHLFDIAQCDSSATDEDGDYEPRPSRKRGRSAVGAFSAEKVKQETPSGEDFDPSSKTAHDGPAATDAVAVSRAGQTSSVRSQTSHSASQALTSQSQHGQDLQCEGQVDPEMEPLGGGSCMAGNTERSARCSSATETAVEAAATGGRSELEKLRALLCAERDHNQQMAAIISSLKQDKELLQHEVIKKAALICDFLQDKLHPEKRLLHFADQTEPGSSHAASPEDTVGFDSPTMFDSFEEMELHPPEHHQPLRTKRSRDGENPRVRMKNVVGVIARYVAALKEFRRSVSMKVAFDRVGVDRNTISRTAAIAELSMAAPEVFHSLAPWNEKEETLAHYVHRCRQAMDDNIKAKIKTMKAKGELLPIASK